MGLPIGNADRTFPTDSCLTIHRVAQLHTINQRKILSIFERGFVSCI